MDPLDPLTLPLREGRSFAPLIHYTLLPDLPALPSNEIMTNAYRARKQRAQSLMLEHCALCLFRTTTPTHCASRLACSWDWGSFWQAVSTRCALRKATWPPTPPGLMLTTPRSAPSVGPSPRRSVTPSSAVPPRPQHKLTTSKPSPL